MLRTVRAFAAALLLACAPFAGATAIPVGTTTANDLILNVDLSSTFPSGPYVPLGFVLSVVNPTSTPIAFSFDLFGGLNGAAFVNGLTLPSLATTATVTVTCTAATGDCASLVDGIFSIGVRGSQVGLVLTSLVVSATNAAGVSNTFNLVTSVPEPATLALLGLGLTGIALTRRRWQ